MMRIDRTDLSFLVPISIVHTFLLLFRISRQSLWNDEVMTLGVVTGTWAQVRTFFTSLPEQGPVYYILLRPWVELGTSELVLRSLSALFAAATLWFFYVLVREIANVRMARVATALLCFSPFLIYFGQEARMYSLLALQAVVSTLLLLHWSRTGARRHLVAYGVVALVAVYTHLFFFFLMTGHLTFLLLRDRALRAPQVQLIVVQGVVGVLYLPWVALIVMRGAASQDWKGIEHIVLGLPYALLRFSLGYSEVLPNMGWKERPLELLAANAPILVVAMAVFGTLAWLGLRELRASRSDGALLAFCALAVPPLLALALSAIVILTGERYLIVSFPFYLLLIAAGLIRLTRDFAHRRLLIATVALLYVGVVGRSLYRYYFDDEFGKEQWAEVADYLRERAEPADVVVTYSSMAYPSLTYYYTPTSAGPRVLRGERTDPAEVGEARRLWLVLSHAPNGREATAVFAGRRTLVHSIVYPKHSGIEVLLFVSDEGN